MAPLVYMSYVCMYVPGMYTCMCDRLRAGLFLSYIQSVCLIKRKSIRIDRFLYKHVPKTRISNVGSWKKNQQKIGSYVYIYRKRAGYVPAAGARLRGDCPPLREAALPHVHDVRGHDVCLAHLLHSAGKLGRVVVVVTAVVIVVGGGVRVAVVVGGWGSVVVVVVVVMAMPPHVRSWRSLSRSLGRTYTRTYELPQVRVVLAWFPVSSDFPITLKFFVGSFVETQFSFRWVLVFFCPPSHHHRGRSRPSCWQQ